MPSAKNSNGAGHNGLYKKGQSGNPAGRKPGTVNKTTGILKEAILIAASNVGDELAQSALDAAREAGIDLASVNGGLVGYLELIARSEPRAFCGLLGRVLPLVVKSDIDETALDRAQRAAEEFTARINRLAERTH